MSAYASPILVVYHSEARVQAEQISQVLISQGVLVRTLVTDAPDLLQRKDNDPDIELVNSTVNQSSLVIFVLSPKLINNTTAGMALNRAHHQGKITPVDLETTSDEDPFLDYFREYAPVAYNQGNTRQTENLLRRLEIS